MKEILPTDDPCQMSDEKIDLQLKVIRFLRFCDILILRDIYEGINDPKHPIDSDFVRDRMLAVTARIGELEQEVMRRLIP